MRFLSILIACVFILTACKSEPKKPTTEKTQELVSESRAYNDPLKQAAFRAALEKEGIPFKVSQRSDGREQLEWSGEYSIKVSQIEAQLFPDSQPSLRSIPLDDPELKKFTQWLKQQKIPYEVISRQGRQYVLWREVDNANVERSGFIPKNGG